MGDGLKRGWLARLVCLAMLLNLQGLFGVREVRAFAGSTLEDDAERATHSPDAAAGAKRCADGLRLVASVVNDAHPQLSLAVLRNQSGARVLALGGRLDDLVLVTLAPHYAELRTPAGELCIVHVFDPALRPAASEAPRPSAPSGEPESKPAASRATLSQDELQKGIQPLGGGDYAISKELLLRALKNPGGAAAGAHFRMAERNGHALGMEARAVREGSTLHRMGVRSGDVVRSVNGIDVSTPLGMLEALRAAQSADTLTLSILRDGQERALRYLVQ